MFVLRIICICSLESTVLVPVRSEYWAIFTIAFVHHGTCMYVHKQILSLPFTERCGFAVSLSLRNYLQTKL